MFNGKRAATRKEAGRARGKGEGLHCPVSTAQHSTRAHPATLLTAIYYSSCRERERCSCSCSCSLLCERVCSSARACREQQQMKLEQGSRKRRGSQPFQKMFFTCFCKHLFGRFCFSATRTEWTMRPHVAPVVSGSCDRALDSADRAGLRKESGLPSCLLLRSLIG